MFTLIAGVLLALLFLLKLIAVQGFASNIGIFIFINNWFVWFFAFLIFVFMYSTNRRLILSLVIASVIGLVMRLLLKV